MVWNSSEIDMTIANEKLVVKTVTLDESKLRRALKLPQGSLKSFMAQPRAITHLATHWVEQAFGVPVINDGAGGAVLPHPMLSLRATIRCFNRGKIMFQQSKRMGVHREPNSTRQEMIGDVERHDYFMVCDVRHFPRIDIYPIRSAKILNFIHGRDVGKSGITPRQFDQFIRENFDVNYVDYDHADFTRLNRRRKRQERTVAVGQVQR